MPSTTPAIEEQTIELGGKLPIKVKGIIGILGTIVIGLCMAIVWLINFSLGSWGKPFDIQQSLGGHIQEMATVHEESNYILSVCLNPVRIEECKRLNLQMPDSLRKKQRQEQ